MDVLYLLIIIFPQPQYLIDNRNVFIGQFVIARFYQRNQSLKSKRAIILLNYS